MLYYDTHATNKSILCIHCTWTCTCSIHIPYVRPHTHTHIPTHSLEMVKWVWVDSTHLSDEADPREQHSMVLLIEQLPHGRHIHLHQVRHLTNYPHCTQGSLQVHVHVCEAGVQWRTQWTNSRPMGKWPFTWHCTCTLGLWLFAGTNFSGFRK